MFDLMLKVQNPKEARVHAVYNLYEVPCNTKFVAVWLWKDRVCSDTMFKDSNGELEVYDLDKWDDLWNYDHLTEYPVVFMYTDERGKASEM
jgi:hypothetical protein